MICRSTRASEQSFGPPTGLTLIPTTSPGSNSARQASAQARSARQFEHAFLHRLADRRRLISARHDAAGMFHGYHAPAIPARRAADGLTWEPALSGREQ